MKRTNCLNSHFNKKRNGDSKLAHEKMFIIIFFSRKTPVKNTMTGSLAKCLVHKHGDLSLIPSAYIKSKA